MDLAASPSIGASGSLLFTAERKTLGFTVGINDLNKHFICASAITVTLDAAATLGNGFYFFVSNESVGAITVDANAAETISHGPSGTSAPTFVLKTAGDVAMFLCVQGVGATWQWTVFPGQNSYPYQNTLTSITTPVDADHFMVGSVANADMRKITIGNAKKMPSFSVHRNNVNQGSFSDATYVKVQHTTELFDTDGYFDSSTNYRYTPLMAGKYLFIASGEMNGMTSTANYCNSGIFKNGSLVNRGRDYGANGTSADVVPVCTAVIDMNGSTDYVEHFMYQNDGGTRTLSGAVESTYFMGCRISS